MRREPVPSAADEAFRRRVGGGRRTAGWLGPSGLPPVGCQSRLEWCDGRCNVVWTLWWSEIILEHVDCRDRDFGLLASGEAKR